ncbi:GNAT family N-acetyltransferase [Flavobacterium haoranii]|uniref:Putative acetyltransferase n=1 Tax=Flavobacterium haoranii TaxID=683124 RepID=A0A1M6BIJ0_9FLAO|nr:GNAT family N-acetyltransferase [Flavobacterium haoranii]SHI48303.1 putative acetyltransferase [Flavobacterium haoranii]
MNIRTIKKEDNPQIATIIRNVFDELDAPKCGTAYADPILDTLYEVYQEPKSIYFVIENEGKIVGGGGLASLQNGENAYCELQKMYFAPEARGLGLGKQIIENCLAFAKEQGFKYCYLETLPFMESARKLYEKMGFQYLDKPLGATGHTSCDVWMIKEL